jgi:hypothetical protein
LDLRKCDSRIVHPRCVQLAGCARNVLQPVDVKLAGCRQVRRMIRFRATGRRARLATCRMSTGACNSPFYVPVDVSVEVSDDSVPCFDVLRPLPGTFPVVHICRRLDGSMDLLRYHYERDRIQITFINYFINTFN